MPFRKVILRVFLCVNRYTFPILKVYEKPEVTKPNVVINQSDSSSKENKERKRRPDRGREEEEELLLTISILK